MKKNNSVTTVRFFSRKNMFMIAFIATGLAVILFDYNKGISWLINIWWNDKEYSHGFLVPLVAGYLIWLKKDYFSSIRMEPDLFRGGVGLLLSGMLLVAGRAGGFPLAEAISLLFILPAIVIFLWGWNFLKAVALPLAYLQFMVPWMDEFIDRIHWPFQMLSAKFGVAVLNLVNIPVFQDGKYIHLPNITLEVARECSGVAFLTSVIALGIPLVYLTQKTWRRGVIVILAGVLVTILTNGARVALVSVMSYKYGAALSHGPAHIFQGWFVAQIGFVALFVINWLVMKGGNQEGCRLFERWKAHPAIRNDGGATGLRIAPYVVIVGYLLILGISAQYLFVPKPVVLKDDFGRFPTRIASWEGKDSNWIQGEKFFLGVDAQVKRVYAQDGGGEVLLYIGYFEVQRQGKSLINFRANPLRKEGKNTVVDTQRGGDRNVNLLESKPVIDGKPYNALMWYRFPDRETAGRYETKLKGITDALAHRRNNGAVILIASEISGGTDSPSDRQMLKTFAKEMHPVLGGFLP